MLIKRRNFQNSRGQALVEMALILPILCLLIFGMFDLARVFNVYLVATESSRVGARAAVLGHDDTYVKSTVVSSGAAINLLETNVTILAPSRARGEPITVVVTKDVIPVTPFYSSFLGELYQVTSQTVMRME